MVDDKLAKEKLIREIDALRDLQCGIKEAMELIRNTDLTDCQPQKAKSDE